MSESKQGESRITVTCPSCHQAFRANVSLAGQTVKCPQCSEPIPIQPFEPPPPPRGHAIDGTCPACNRKYRVRGVVEGQVIRCPLCDTTIYAVPSDGCSQRHGRPLRVGGGFSTGLHVAAFVVLLMIGMCHMAESNERIGNVSEGVRVGTFLLMLTMIICTSFIAAAIQRQARDALDTRPRRSADRQSPRPVPPQSPPQRGLQPSMDDTPESLLIPLPKRK